MKKLLILTILIVVNLNVKAQFIKEKAILAKIGYGLSAPYNNVDDVASSGFYLQTEYIMKVKSWLQLIPYAGFISTHSDGKDFDGNPTFEKAESTAVFLGGKTKVRATIPYFAPYFELGLGASIGKFETLTAFNNIEKRGLVLHVPFSIGVELGKNHDVDLGLTFYYHNAVKQFSGAYALGIRIPIKNKKN